MVAMKAPDAFRTISEVASELDLPQHVLRFWESRFTQIKPMKRGGGRRYYRPEDVDLLRGIRLMLYDEGFTIRGVQRLLKDKGVGFVAAAGRTGSVEGSPALTEDDTDSGAPQPIVTDAEERENEEAAEEDASAAEPRHSAPIPPPARPLSTEVRRRMRSVLQELEEAKRLLDQVR
jgi:DNA-binding transcriptional MerR regulator